jgi:heparanase 1
MLLIALLSCLAPGADRAANLQLDTSRVVATLPERYLSVAVDTGQVAGTKFWAPDASGELAESEVEPYDFTRKRLEALAQKLGPAILRVGGTEADRVWYELTDEGYETGPMPDEGYEGVISQSRWRDVITFAKGMDFTLMFTLNIGPQTWRDGAWDASNAEALLRYAGDKGDPVDVWELGNEPNGYLLLHGESVDASDYGAEISTLAALRDAHTPDAKVAAPATAFWPEIGEIVPYVDEALEVGGGDVDIVTWHYYPQQSERCTTATREAGPEVMLDPDNLDEVHTWAAVVEGARDAHAPQAEVWLGETGNAQCGGQPGVSDAYAGGFWWLDQLGAMASRGQTGVVRQTLSGSDYGLLDDETLDPRPDYWVSLLWKRLMGPEVLSLESDDPSLRAYAHCAADGRGISLALLNLDTERSVEVDLDATDDQIRNDAVVIYLLTSEGLESSKLWLNDILLEVGDDNVVPTLQSEDVKSVVLPAASYAFVQFPELEVEACGG